MEETSQWSWKDVQNTQQAYLKKYCLLVFGNRKRGVCVKSGRSQVCHRRRNFLKNITRLITNLPFIFQICCFICPQVQKDSKAVHLLMSISCKIDVISLKLKQIGQFTKRFPRLHILAPYIRKIYGRFEDVHRTMIQCRTN